VKLRRFSLVTQDLIASFPVMNPPSINDLVRSLLMTTLVALCFYVAFDWWFGILKAPLGEFPKYLSISGGFGGVLYGFVERQRKFELVQLCGTSHIQFGSFADVLVGVGAAYGIVFVLPNISNIQLDNRDTALRIIGLGTIAGVAGKALLSRLRDGLIRKVEQLEEEVESNRDLMQKKMIRNRLYTLGEQYRLHKKWLDAKWAFNEMLDIDPANTSALVGMATTLRDESLYDSTADKQKLLLQAIDLCHNALKVESDFAPGYLMRASIQFLLGSYSAEVEADLKKALQLDPTLRQFIIADDVFNKVQNEDWMKKLFN
ncbi:MAG: hypothetical protein JWM68_3674, partial [Verrucomicrobiales bacterium]|nr:hypothetical protein [Verrucomicrobiales bacterium]